MTVTVSVTVSPYTAGSSGDTVAVVVSCPTATLIPVDVLVLKSSSPSYTAVIVCVP